ncbi:MAG: hypothetical protein J3Q66DRAFT_398521 [Benniella sp.]|nr:MAG: hypothetical protein J3Q66DRAFT_398521 [Benniella sp.]
MPQASLPLECLLKILHVLANQDSYDTDTMARLLRVSKTFCAATLPFLYGDGLDICIRKRHVDHKYNSTTTTAQMIRTLLRQVHPQNRIPGLLRVACLSQDGQDDLESTEEQSPSPPIFKYGRFIRRIVSQWEKHGHPFRFVPINSLVMEYATTHQLFDQYVAEEILFNNIPDDFKAEALQDALKMDTHRQLIWMLCQDHMDTIEELTIPVFDIERYIDHVGQFTFLSKVIFSDDNDTNPWWGYRKARDGNEFAYDQEVAPEKHNRYSRGILQFVQQHTSIHKNVLRNMEANSWMTPDVFFEIQALLPPLHNPQSIDYANWGNFVGRVKDTNLDHAESITLYIKYEARYLGWGQKQEKAYEIIRNQPFLPRCRVLKELKMDTLGPDMFQWAVQEKKQRDEARQRKRIPSQNVSTRQHRYHNNDLEPLVPLRSVTIGTQEWQQPPVQELDDIAFAFSDTLEELVMQAWWDKAWNEFEHLASTPQVAYGRGWNLLHLRNLVLSVNHFQLHFDMEGLRRCRALESIRLNDEIMLYDHQEVRSWSPVSLPHLKLLDLQGSTALHFNMDSLHHSPCLETLRLGIQSMSEGRYYIPSAEELERDDSDNQGTDSNEVSEMPGSNQGEPGSIVRRPRYTWDWHLPNLSCVSLAAVFAFQFDFQWLQYLPNLQEICLYMKSSQNNDSSITHERHVTLKDISRGQQLHQQDEDGSEEEILSDRFISLPKVTLMHFIGLWNFEEKVVEIICSFVAPNLAFAYFGEGPTGITFQRSTV